MSREDDILKNESTVLATIKRHLPPLNFISLHYAYFVIVCLIGSVIFWGSSEPKFSVSYVDSLFLVVSAMTEAGLNTVNLSTLTTWQQAMLFLLIMLGSTIWVSIWTVVARKKVFQTRFDDVVRAERAKMSRRFGGSSLSLRSLTSRRTPTIEKSPTPPNQGPNTGGILLGEIITETATNEGPESPKPPKPSTPVPHIAFTDTPHPRQEAGNGGIASPKITLTYSKDKQASMANTAVDEQATEADDEHLAIRRFLMNRASGQHGEFHGLSKEERKYLGGCEYRALRLLSAIVPLYFVLWQLLGCLALGAWMNNHMPNTARENGINPWWLGLFNGVSAFNNSGMSLLDANMIPFQSAYFVLITMGLMILAGNTAYPLFLRFILWAYLRLLQLTTSNESMHSTKTTLEFILKYPRRVYTNLFPSRPSWWLFFMVICLNTVDWVAFELLNIGNPVIESIPTGPRILDGLFQALAVRSGGFYVVPISQIAISVQFLYVIMMYISVYPVVITMRHSNIYEERSLGIYYDDERASDDTENALLSDDEDGHGRQSTSAFSTGTNTSQMRPNSSHRPTIVRRLSQSIPAADIGRALQRSLTPWHGVGVPPVSRSNAQTPNQIKASRISFLSQQIHGQLAHDIWWLVLAVFIITAIEGSSFNADPVVFSVFNIIFEVVSAYGTVGISVGLPNDAYSFSGAWHTASKLVLCLVMLRGRHRGLPVALDHAVRLPSEHLHQDEEEDYQIRRSLSRGRMNTAEDG